MIVLRELYPQVVGILSGIDSGTAGWALAESAIRLAKDTALLKGVTLGTLTLDAASFPVVLPAGRSLVRVDKVEIQDPTDPDLKWVRVPKTARVYQQSAVVGADSLPTSSRPSEWALSLNTLFFAAPSDAAYPVRISYAWAPTRLPEFDSVDFPEEAEDALIAFAEHKLLRLAGPSQNLNASEAMLASYKAKISGLRSIADTGQSGSRSVFDFLPQE